MQKFDRTYLILVLPILRMTMPWVSARLNMKIAFALTMLWLLIKFMQPSRMNVFTVKLKVATIKLVAVMAFFTVLPFLYRFVGFGGGDWSFYNTFWTFVFSVAWVVVVYFTMRDGRIREMKMLSLICLSGIAITGIRGIFVLDQMSEIGSARALVGLTATGLESMQDAKADAVFMAFIHQLHKLRRSTVPRCGSKETRTLIAP